MKRVRKGGGGGGGIARARERTRTYTDTHTHTGIEKSSEKAEGKEKRGSSETSKWTRAKVPETHGNIVDPVNSLVFDLTTVVPLRVKPAARRRWLIA